MSLDLGQRKSDEQMYDMGEGGQRKAQAGKQK
jgi:hypothetical protein